jgi:hypothetical protein
VLAAFVAHLYTEKLATNTVKNYLAALRHALGMGDPQMGNMPCLEYVVKAGPRPRVSNDQNRQRLLITPEILETCMAGWNGQEGYGDVVGSGHHVFLWLP